MTGINRKLIFLGIVILFPNFLESQSKEMIKLKWYDYILLSPMIVKSGIEDVVSRYEKDKRNRENLKTLSSLHKAILDSDIKKIKDLVRKGENLEARDYRGETPLFYAVKTNNFEIVSFLLENKASANSLENQGIPVVHYAIKNKNIAILKLLISSGVDINTKNNGSSLLKIACSFPPISFKIIQFLVENGVDVNAADKYSYTPLMVLTLADEPDLMAIKYLMRNGANVNSRDKQGRNSLHILIENKSLNFELIKLLVETGSNIKNRDKEGKTILDLINENYETVANEDIVKYLKSNLSK